MTKMTKTKKTDTTTTTDGIATVVKSKKTKKITGPTVVCSLCGHEAKCLTTHLKRQHDMTGKEYQATYGKPLFSADLLDQFKGYGQQGIQNDWNVFVRLYGQADDAGKERIHKTAEEVTGITMQMVRDGHLD